MSNFSRTLAAPRRKGVSSECRLVKAEAFLGEALATRRVGEVLEHELGRQLLHAQEGRPDLTLISDGHFHPGKLFGAPRHRDGLAAGSTRPWIPRATLAGAAPLDQASQRNPTGLAQLGPQALVLGMPAPGQFWR